MPDFDGVEHSDYSLGGVTMSRGDDSPRILVHGPGGAGKTTFAIHAPKAVYVPLERGLTSIKGVATFPRIDSFVNLTQVIQTLIVGDHQYRSIIIDGISALTPLVWDYTASKNGKGSVTDFQYKTGYRKAQEVWERLVEGGLQALSNKGMLLLLVANTRTERFTDPSTGETYDRYVPDLPHDTDPQERSIRNMLCNWADITLFMNIKDEKRVMYTEERPGWVAKNRFCLPPELPLEYDAFSEAMLESITNKEEK